MENNAWLYIMVLTKYNSVEKVFLFGENTLIHRVALEPSISSYMSKYPLKVTQINMLWVCVS